MSGIHCPRCKSEKIQMLSENGNRREFICTECGFKFRHFENMIAEREKNMKVAIIAIIALIVLGIWILSNSFKFRFFISMSILLFACYDWYKQKKEERDDLIQNGWDANCYLEKKKQK